MTRQKIELFEDRKNEFRWRLVSAQKIIATSGEGYQRKAGVKQAIKSVTKAFTGGTDLRIPVVDLTVDVTNTKPTLTARGKKTAKTTTRTKTTRKATRRKSASA